MGKPTIMAAPSKPLKATVHKRHSSAKLLTSRTSSGTFGRGYKNNGRNSNATFQLSAGDSLSNRRVLRNPLLVKLSRCAAAVNNKSNDSAAKPTTSSFFEGSADLTPQLPRRMGSPKKSSRGQLSQLLSMARRPRQEDDTTIDALLSPPVMILQKNATWDSSFAAGLNRTGIASQRPRVMAMRSNKMSVSALSSLASIRLQSATSLVSLGGARRQTPLSQSCHGPVASAPARLPLRRSLSRRDASPSVAASLPEQGEMVQVAPYLKARFRGVQDTWACVQRDHYLPTSCNHCGLELCCIKDVSYLFCPNCRQISKTSQATEAANGVGIGLTLEDLKNLETADAC